MKSSLVFITLYLLLFVFPQSINAQDKDLALYTQIKAFSLTGGAVDVKGFVLKRDRAQITLDGTVYLTDAAGGQITGAVFLGEGKFSLETPPADFEKNNIRRLTGMDTIETDFKTAVFRFTDDSAQQLGTAHATPANERAEKLAKELEPRLLKELGLNLSSRLAQSILNRRTLGSSSELSTVASAAASI